MGTYDKAEADRIISHIKSLHHTKDPWAGKPFNLKPWQEDWIREIFGTRNENGLRQYRTTYFEIPRKNGKSELAAAIAMMMLFWDHELGAEIYSAAADKDQAGIVFGIVVAMIRQDKFYLDRCKIYESTKTIKVLETNSTYKALSAEHATKHGFNASCIIFDELHAQPNRDLWDVLTTSVGTRRQPLVVAITTAGFDKNSICWEQHEYARKVKEGVINDPTFYPVLYFAPEDADWTDEGVWQKCNPALGDFRNIDEMRAACKKALEVPAYENTFRRLYLNQWTAQESRYISIRKWDECAGQVDRGVLSGRQCYAGMDLASSIDIASVVLVFGDKYSGYDVLPFFWIPADTVREKSRQDQAPYEQWVQEGLVLTTPGNQIDLKFIEQFIDNMQNTYDIQEIAYDRWGALQISTNLAEKGFTVVPFGQGFASMAAPTGELLSLVLGQKIRHGGNPVLRWMCDNMTVRQDPAGNVKPDKGKSTARIDGMVALIMALDRCIRHEAEGPSIYETEEMIVV